MRTFSIVTLGCKVNQYESEQIAALLRGRGLTQVEPGEADLRIVNTCSVTTEAAGKSRQAARRQTRLPVLQPSPPESPAGSFAAHDPGAASNVPRPRVIVTGCWATSDSAEASRLPGVDAVLGHHENVALKLEGLLTEWEQDDFAGPQGQHVHRETPPIKGEGWIENTRTQGGIEAGEITNDNKAHAAGEVKKNRSGPLSGVQRSLVARSSGPLPPKLRGEGGGEGSNDDMRDPCNLSSDPSPQPSPLSTGERGPEDFELRGPSSPGPENGTFALPLLGARHTGHQRAFLKVQDGCDAHCTYCIIPRLRSTLWSKPVDDAVAEAQALVDAGHAEIILTGIFLGAFGQTTALRRRQARSRASDSVGSAPRTVSHDLPGTIRTADAFRVPQSNAYETVRGADPARIARGRSAAAAPLGALVEALCTRVRGLRRLRLSSLEPGDLTADLLSIFRAHPQVVPHFHLPLQSGSDALLRRMNRQYTRDDFLRTADAVERAFDRPAFTTDIIAGFPGETDAEFAQTLEIVERVRFIHIHAFPFSPRPGTAAARWSRDFVRGPVVNERIALLRDRARTHSFAYREQFLGETVELLVERPSAEEADAHAMAGYQHGRCERYFAVHFQSDRPRVGEAVRVRIERVTTEHTIGIPVV